MTSSSTRIGGASFLIIVLIAAGAVGGTCGDPIVQDPTFRDWCDDHLCAWKLDEGVIAQVPTWSASDRGVAFVATPTRISQVSETHDACLLFTAVGNIEPSAQLALDVDFNADGTIEYSAPLGGAPWERFQARITGPKSFRGIRFTLRKSGIGAAVLALMDIESAADCAGAPPTFAPESLVLGQACTASSECVSGLVCAGPAYAQLCSECAETWCADHLACEAHHPSFPAQCGPGLRRRATGEACVADDDCAGGVCAGAKAELIYGDGTCTLGLAFAGDAGSNCVGYGVRAGSCL